MGFVYIWGRGRGCLGRIVRSRIREREEGVGLRGEGLSFGGFGEVGFWGLGRGGVVGVDL